MKDLYASHNPDSGVWTDTIGEPPSNAICSYLNAEACDAVIECVREKGGVEALESMGYPSPGAGCPTPLESDFDNDSGT